MSKALWELSYKQAKQIMKHQWDIAGMEWEFAERDRRIKEHNQKCFVGTGSLIKN